MLTCSLQITSFYAVALIHKCNTATIRGGHLLTFGRFKNILANLNQCFAAFSLPFSFSSVPVHGYEDISGIWEELLQAALLRVIAEVANKQAIARGTTTTTYSMDPQ